MSVYKLFEIENDERLFEFKFVDYGYPMWAFIRTAILEAVHNKLFNIKKHVASIEEYVPQKKMLNYYITSAFKTPFTYNQKDIIFFFPSIWEKLNDNNEYESHVYSNHFNAAKEKSVLIQTPFNYEYTKHKVDGNFSTFGFINILVNNDKSDVSENDLKTIDHLICYLKERINVDIEKKIFTKARNHLVAVASKIRPTIKYYRKLYESVSPKAVVINCAHYLGMFAPVRCAVAKEMGIKVIELQHSMIYTTHCAYSFGSSALESTSFKNLLPNYFLTYGDYWNNLINTPSKCVSIGRPDFYKKTKLSIDLPDNTILVLDNFSDESDKHLSNYAIELAAELPNFNITYRFHPRAKRMESIVKKLTCNNLKNIKIDTNTDIYNSLYENEYVVGDTSTVLYEALCLKNKVFVLKTQESQSYIDPTMFTLFETPADLIQKIKNKESITIDSKTKESLFGSDFPETYIKFLSYIGIKV